MSQVKDATVWVQPLGGTWEVLGRSRRAGIMVENLTCAADLWGPSKATFDLRRDVTVLWPDLQAFTPVDIEIAGVKVWSGRISETPTNESSLVINVQCDGWQFHLDDDVYQQCYAHTSLSDWVDMRNWTGGVTPLNFYTTAYTVSTTPGQGILIALPKGQTIPGFGTTGVVLDLGPVARAGRVILTYSTSTWVNTALFWVGYAADGSVTSGPTVIAAAPLGVAGPTTMSFDPAAGTRYVEFRIQDNGTGTAGTDLSFVRINAVSVFGSTAWATTGSGAVSTLKASDVITNALTGATVLLSSDVSKIIASSFAIPTFAPDGDHTPRENITAVNAFQDWITQIDVEKRMVFKPKPSVASLEVGAWSGALFDDASTNSGDDIYNRALVEGQTPDGLPVRVERAAAQQAGVLSLTSSSPAFANPSFDVDAANWTNTTRDTATFDTAPASGSVTAGTTAVATLTGTFLAGVAYTVECRCVIATQFVGLLLGTATDYANTGFVAGPHSFATMKVTWTPQATPVGVQDVAEVPTFHVFASKWLTSRRGELRPSTIALYTWQLTDHLLPFFAHHLLTEITVQQVDCYRHAKVAEGKLSASSINKTLTRLAQILEDAVEYDHIVRNPARGRRRRLKVTKPRPVHLESAEQIQALLDAATELDATSKARTRGRRALIATLVFAGLRISEACALQWRDVDLGNSRITVGDSKTDAGMRRVDIRPALHDELAAHKASAWGRHANDDLVFPTASGTARDKDNARVHVINPVVEKADELLAERELLPLPRGVTAHKLRHTYASILAALGEPMPYVMAQIGHTDPAFTLKVYAHAMRRGTDELARLKALVEDGVCALTCTSCDSKGRTVAPRSDVSRSETA